MHENSILLFSRYAKHLFQDGMVVLEIGPDQSPSTYENLVSDRVLDWQTLDLARSKGSTHVASGPEVFPLKDNSFDIVISGQVVEHVARPWRWICETARVLRPGGYLITIVPVSWYYHEAPIDCWRIFPEGMRSLHEEAELATVFTWFGSLEVPQYPKKRMGVSLSWQSPGRRLVSKILGRFCFPVERAYDTIAIARK